MANFINIISPRQCGVVKERNNSKQQNNNASLPHTNYSLVSTFFNFGQYSASSTFENMEAEDDHRDDSTVNVDSDVDLFSTMNSGKDQSPQGKSTRRCSPQNSFDKNNKVLNFDGCMLHRKRCSGTCAGDSVTMYRTSNSSTTSSSCKRDRYHHMRKSPSTRSMGGRRGARYNSHSTGSSEDSSDSFEHDTSNDSTKICESFSVERDQDSMRSCESSVERKKRISSSFILSRNDSIDSETISTSASFQSKESNLSLSDVFSKETNTLDSGTLSASASFQSKDTIGNITSSDLYSKETLTEENYDSSDSRSESKSTLTSKDSIINTTNATFHFDRFFRKDSYTDTYDSSDSRSESTVTGTSVEDEEEEDDYSSDHSRSSSYADKSHSSEARTERDDNTFRNENEMDNFHTTSRVLTSAEHTGQFLIESKQNLESLVESETSSTSGCTTSFDDTPFDRSPIQDDMVLACRSPMEFSAAIEDISVHDNSMNVVLQPIALDKPSLQKQSSIISKSKIASDRADYIVVSLADDTTEISISNMTSSCSDFIVYDSYMGSVRTDDLYDPKNSCSTHEQYGISQHTNLSSNSLYDGALFSNVIFAQNSYSRADEIAISHAVEVHNTFSYAGSSVSSCHDVNPLNQTSLANDVERLDTFPPPPPPYDAAFLDMQHMQQLLTSSEHPSHDRQRCTGNTSNSETDKSSDVGAKQNASKIPNAIDAIYNSASSLHLKDSVSNNDRCASDPLLKGPVHNKKDAEMIIDDTAASHPLPALSSTSDQKTITKQYTSKVQNGIDAMYNTASSLNLKDSFSNIDLCSPDPLLKGPVHKNRDVERIIDDTAASHPLPALSSTSGQKSITNPHNDYGASSLNPLSLSSTDTPLNPLKSCIGVYIDDVNSSSFIQSSDRTSPTNRLETSVCLLEDDLSFFTAMNEPQLSIETDSNYVTAANSAQSQGFIFSDFFQGCVENSLVCDSGNGISSSLLTRGDNIAEGKTIRGDEVQCLSRDIELKSFKSSADEALFVESKKISIDNDQTDRMAKHPRGAVEAATSEEKLCAMIEQLDSNDYNVVNMILTDSDINQIFHGNKSEMQRIEDTPDTTIKEADSNEIQKASFKVGEKVAAVSGEYSDQVTAAMSEILLHCRRLELLDEGISQEAVHERINSAVMKIVQVCRQFDVSADSFCRNTVSNDRLSYKLKSDTEVDEDVAKYGSQIEKEQPCNDFGVEGTSSIEQGIVSERVFCTHSKHLFKERAKPADLSTEPFKDNYPVSPSKTPRRSNQRRRAARLMEGLNSLKSTHVYENTESKEKETGPSTTIQFKETSQPIIALSVGVEDTLKIPETQALASPYKLIRQVAFSNKAFEKQNVANTEIVRDTPLHPCRTGRRRRTSAAAASREKPTYQINNKDFVQNDKMQDETSDEIGSSILKNKDPAVNLGNALALGEREESDIDNTTEKGRKEGKNERKLSRKQSERNNRFFKRNATTELTKDTEMAEVSSVLKGIEDKVSHMVPSTDKLKNALEGYEKHHLSETTNAEKIEKKCLHVSSCDLDDRDENTLDKAQSLEMRMSTDDVTGIAPSANDPSAFVSPSKQYRRLERAAKMLDLRKNKNRSSKNERGELDLTFLNDASVAGKDFSKTKHYDDAVKMHVENNSFREEVVMLTSSGSSNSFKASSLSVDTTVQDCSFDETVCTTKHSNVFSTYLRCTAPLTPDSRLTDRETVRKADDTFALQHPLLSTPKSLHSTPRSFRKIASPAAARDRIKIARKLWHTNNSSTFNKPFE